MDARDALKKTAGISDLHIYCVRAGIQHETSVRAISRNYSGSC
jgi:hypothetical protein